ncbi:MAG TPA: hypothetical protein DCG33_06120 [Prevotellaceae bacterium]|nr:hypothetical protein [Prevotellaceae bacterium]
MIEVKDLILVLIANNALWAFAQFLISRHDRKADEKNGLTAALQDINKKLEDFAKEIKGKLKKQEKDAVRTQLLVLILLKPEEEQEILTLGEHYFKNLKGNWYMTSIFKNWIKEYKVANPDWFETEK